MRYRRFGRTEIEIPLFSCGGMRYQQSWDASDAYTDENQRNLEATINRALEVGIHHIETARGYGTSEVQLGVALAKHSRDEFVLQTKVAPSDDPDEFERQLAESFERLGVDRIDLFAFHGINANEHLERTIRPGGCWEVADRWRREGRIGHIGFSTHGSCAHITNAIESDRFDYVNIHWYYIFQDNLPALQAATARDMGVFIISPSDKGGRLYDPPQRLLDLCQPLSPMLFNDLFCLTQPWIHTLSLGAARPSDFDEHLKVLDLLDRADEVLPPIVEALDERYRESVGEPFASNWRQGIEEWDRNEEGVNIKSILWLRNLVRAFDLDVYARGRYNMLSRNDHWFPGNKADIASDEAIRRSVATSPFVKEIPGYLRETHTQLHEEPES